MDKQNVIKAMFWTKVKLAVVVCAALVVAIGCAGLAQEAAKRPPEKNIVHVATDGSGDYKTDGTDDQVEINQALLDIHKKGGGTVHIKKGTYTIGDSIVIYSDTILEGDGWTSVIKLKDHAGWPRGKPLVTNEKFMHRAKGVNTNIKIRNLKIDGNRGKMVGRKWTKQGPGWGGNYYNGIYLHGVDGAIMSGLWIGNNLNDQIHPTKCKNITVRGCTLKDGGHDCVYFYLCDTVRVENCRLHIRCNCGIRVYGTNHAVISGNILHPVLDPVAGKGGAGIQIQSHGGKQEMNDILIENNVLFGISGMGIFPHTDSSPEKPGLLKVTMRNNVLFHCGGSAIDNHNFDMLVENNTFYCNKRSAIAFCHYRRPTDVPLTITARNNIIAGNMDYGLTTAGLKNARIISSYNNVWGNKTGNYNGKVEIKRDISVNPLFVNDSIPFARANPKQLEMDLHLKSRDGRWEGKKWVKDDVTSPCIDAGNPSFAYSKEPNPNGKRINLGGYGNTEKASKSTGMARGTIAGKVTDKDTGKPVSGAKLSTGGYFGTTDAEGNYTILDVPTNEYSLKVFAIKYVEQVRDKIGVAENGKTGVDVGLVKEKVPPTVKSHSPAGKNPVGKIIIVAFSEPMNVGSAEKSLSISPSAAGSFKWINSTMYFIPDKSLEYGTKYKITVKGAEDLAGNKLKSPCVWEFSTLSKAEHLVGEWRFEEESGNTAKDSSGRGNHGAIKGNPARVKGKVGRALSFDGDDTIKVPHSESLMAEEEITIEAWVKPTHNEGTFHNYGVVGKFEPGSGGYVLVSYDRKDTHLPKFFYRATYPNGNQKNIATDFKHKGEWSQWVFLTATRDLHGNVKTYVNGELTNAIKTDPVEEVVRGTGELGPFWIGYYHIRNFKGLIDEVRIYNRALSAAEIKADFERTE